MSLGGGGIGYGGRTVERGGRLRKGGRLGGGGRFGGGGWLRGGENGWEDGRTDDDEVLLHASRQRPKAVAGGRLGGRMGGYVCKGANRRYLLMICMRERGEILLHSPASIYLI